MGETASLIGHGEAGKSTFACMCSCISGVKISSYYETLDTHSKNFKLNNILPESNKRIEWDLGIIEQESLFRKWNIQFLDCAGQIQSEVFKTLTNLSKKKKFIDEKLNFEQSIKELIVSADDSTIEYIVNKFNLPLSDWIEIVIPELQNKNKFDYHEIPKILFLKLFNDSNKLILTIDGDLLVDYVDNDKKKEDLYDQFIDYSRLISLKKSNKIAIMITKSYLFGVRKKNISKRPAKELNERFFRFLNNEGSIMGEELKGMKWKLFLVGVPAEDLPKDHPDYNKKHDGVDEIFGVDKLLNWLF